MLLRSAHYKVLANHGMENPSNRANESLPNTSLVACCRGIKVPLTRSVRKNPKLHKRYGCIFTCLRYRAIHIELANDLTTDSFINAVTRFVGRRGPPRIIYSDRPDIIDDNSEIRRGARSQPYAVNTSLGWTVYGPMGEPNSNGIHVNFVRSDHEEMLSMQFLRETQTLDGTSV